MSFTGKEYYDRVRLIVKNNNQISSEEMQKEVKKILWEINHKCVEAAKLDDPKLLFDSLSE